MSDPQYTDDLVVALRLAALDDRDGALTVARLAAGAGSLLGAALVDHLVQAASGSSVYDSPAAFRAFIRGGGNLGLYQATSAHLAQVHRTAAPGSLLEIGPGDGLALLPALADGTEGVPAEITLVEPSADLLAHCAEAVVVSGRTAEPQHTDIGSFLAEHPARTWDLAESTFALHTLELQARDAVLRLLADRVATLTLVEFDVDLPEPGTDEHLRQLALRYEQGLAEYTDSRNLVAQGFLVPVLLGQLAPGTPRATWEQPARAWREQVERAGFTDVELRPVAPYWWSPAFSLVARGRR